MLGTGVNLNMRLAVACGSVRVEVKSPVHARKHASVRDIDTAGGLDLHRRVCGIIPISGQQYTVILFSIQPHPGSSQAKCGTSPVHDTHISMAHINIEDNLIRRVVAN
jgi:hypothetical protein